MSLVSGILETALYVADLNKAAAFYRGLFQFPILLESDRLIAMDVAGRNVLLLFLQGATSEPFPTPGGIIPPHSGAGKGHLAFSIAVEDIPTWEARLAEVKITLESAVEWPGGARSLYFRDPDDNLVELITRGFWSIY